jgi:hypothetical protein
MRWNRDSKWVWSAEQVHEAIIDPATFEAAQRIRSLGARRPTEAKKRTTTRRYVLSGLVACGACRASPTTGKRTTAAAFRPSTR